jgi:hypothetical protein
MGLSPDARRSLEVGLASLSAADDVEKALFGFRPFGTHYYVSTFNGSNSNDGKSFRSPFLTMAKALQSCATHDTIFVVGDVREEISIAGTGLTDLNLKFDVAIIGMGATHHPDSPGATYNYGAACWRAPASPTAATNLLNVYGRGWTVANMLFDCPVDAAAIAIHRNALSDTSEYDAGHFTLLNCRFTDGLIALQNVGGCGFTRVRGNQFQRMSGSGAAAIKCTSTSVAVPLNWVIEDNHFHNNASHILSSMSYSTVRRNIFGRFTATLSVDLYNQPSAGQGEYNVITENYLTGTYGATAFPAGSNNEWAGNQNVAGVTTADPA